MPMSFWWSYIVKDFYFYNFNITSIVGIVAICGALGAMSIMFEFLKLLQAKQKQKELFIKAKQLRTVCPSTETSTLLRANASEPIIITRKDRMILYFTDAFLWLSSFNLSYIIMLGVMVYNGWIFIAIIVGGGIGYYIFGQSIMKINFQNCQTLRDTYCVLNCGETGPVVNYNLDIIDDEKKYPL